MEICVIGCSRGIGLHLAEYYLQAGHCVWGCARSKSDSLLLDRYATQGAFLFTSLDIAEPDAVHQWANSMEKARFKPQLVVLNASIQKDDMTDGGIDMTAVLQVLDINLIGSLQCVAALLPKMLGAGSARFVLIGSTAALRPSMRSTSYCASKAAMSMAFRALGQQYGAKDIDFASVTLGPIATDMWEGKRSILVPSGIKAATAIGRFGLSRSKRLYYPLFTTSLLRMSLWLPDRFFSFISQLLLK